MSRAIDICYRNELDAPRVPIEIPNPYYLFGTQDLSMRFWAMPVWKQLGTNVLSKLGHTDPIFFSGWPMMDVLDHELRLFHENADRIEFDVELKARWLANLTYCHAMLIATAPAGSVPELVIG